MKLLPIPSLWRKFGTPLLILGALVGGTWLTVKTTADYLLYEHATLAAENWAQFLAANVGDLEQIAAGETPSNASLAFLRSVRKSGEVFRYTIFNRYGYSMMESDRDRISPIDLSSYNAHAASAIKQERPIVDARAGHAPEQPRYFAEAFVPVAIGGRPVAAVAAYVDQTAARDIVYRAFGAAAVALCALTVLSFGLPAWAWYRRTEEKRESDRRAQFLAYHDALTGLANRARTIEKLAQLLAVAPSTGDMIALHLIDIDHFKDVNDTLGHEGGDFLLTTVGRRLSELTRVEDTVARLGNDEFMVVQARIAGKAQAMAFAERIVAVLRAPVHYKEHEIDVTFTVGVALAPVDGTTPERLLKSADLALLSGQQGGRNCIRFFSTDLDAAMQKRVALERIIRDAVAYERFELHYQPVIEISSRRLAGFEALARLRAPDGTIIPPSTFIPVAEELRLIDRLGGWVLREACRAATAWPDPLTVAVNLSPAQFDSGGVEDAVAEALKASGLEPRRLELEITETLLLGNNERTMAALAKLKDMGVAIVMDDFGTGYSSLSYLWKFPFDKIKIDRSFMEGYGKSGRDVETVVKSIIALAREMNMRVTVEGVETADQVEFLYDANADQVQGFYFGTPVPAAEVSADILKNFQATQDETKPAAPDDKQQASGGQ
ncbi:MAG TPA: bifunctional diguanylate cyclase/phosphodiesterase [Pseudolabrys sp.]|nr:bifunctional diguanylate cyclase/phosphodiesterase [Pseudolabrys sp.]